MADFNTHALAATAVIGVATTVVSGLLSLNISEASTLVIAGVLGGVLPDVDLRSSQPSKAIALLLGFFAGAAWWFYNPAALGPVEVALSSLLIFLLVRYPLISAVHRRVVTHRGVLHSLIAAIMAGVVTCAVVWTQLSVSALLSWLAGVSMMAGYVTHLLIDELYSIDFANARLKRSFGSATKILDTQRPAASCLVVGITLAAGFVSAPLPLALQQFAQRYSG